MYIHVYSAGVSLEAGYRRSTTAYVASCRRLLIEPSGLLRVYFNTAPQPY